MKKILGMFLLLSAGQIGFTVAQINAGNDTVLCLPQTVTLHATITGVVGTTSYSFGTVPFTPYPYAGTIPSDLSTGNPFSDCDDCVSGAIPIGFSFCFLGQVYTQCYIGTNGWISFSPGQPTTYTSQTIPSTNTAVPKNCIMGPWQDWYPGGGGNGGAVKYQIIGAAPNRKFVVTWDHVPMFSCTTIIGTFQIAINETTNIIENYIENKPNCTTWAGGTGTQGVHNAAGNQAFIVPGRNSTQWTTTNEGWIFIPSGVGWFHGLTALGTGDSIVVHPTVTTTYIAKVELCSGQTFTDSVTIFAGTMTSGLSKTNVTCNNAADGTATLTPVGNASPYHFSWSTAAGVIIRNVTNIPGADLITNLDVGSYHVHVVNAGGCTFDTSFSITQPVAASTASAHSNLLCNNDSSGLVTVRISGGTPPYAYKWNTNPVQNTDSAFHLPVGDYFASITDSNGCVVNSDTTALTEPDSLLLRTTYIPDTCGISNGSAHAIVNGGTTPYTYKWSGPAGATQTEDIAKNLSQGIYSLLVKDDHGCETSATGYIAAGPRVVANFDFDPKPVLLFSPKCTFEDKSVNAMEWFWDFADGNVSDSVNPVHYFQKDGTFPVIQVVSNIYGCTDTMRRDVVVEGFYTFYLPTSFTPNGDGRNDTFIPFTTGVVSDNYHMSIFDRWGSIIFYSNDINTGWNGKSEKSSSLVPNGTYVYQFQFTDYKNQQHTLTGRVTIVE